MTDLVKFIYVWRLDPEKWVDAILQSFGDLLETWKYNLSLDVFGWWALEDKTLKFSSHYDEVTYHGFQKKSKVLETRKEMDYCLVPSIFLETFGLTALDSLGVWVPIIAPAKWGLASFVSDELVLLDDDSDRLTSTLIKAITIKHTTISYKKLVNEANEKYALYWYNSRYSQLKSLWIQNELLIINDYWVNHGWIETLLEEITTQLEHKNHIIKHFSWTDKKLNQLQRYIGLWKTLFNIWATYRLSAIQKESHHVWRHSVHRQLWRLPIFFSSWKSTHWIMIHDMWLLHPFPSVVESESQIKKSLLFIWWIKEWIAAKWFHRLPFILVKRLCMKLIWRQIEMKNMLIQVPSEYLVSHITDRVDSCRVVCVPHFVLQ